jgi:hypothetical protein
VCHPNNGTASSRHLQPPPQQVCYPEMASPSAGLQKYVAAAAAAAADDDDAAAAAADDDDDADARLHSRSPTQE